MHRCVWTRGLPATFDATGCGQAERNWKAMKAQRTGKRSNLSSDKMMKQDVISAAYARHKNDTKRPNG